VGKILRLLNFIASFELAQDLLTKNLTILGIVRKNQAEMLPELLPVNSYNRCLHSLLIPCPPLIRTGQQLMQLYSSNILLAVWRSEESTA
jgi:hypothetical protein